MTTSTLTTKGQTTVPRAVRKHLGLNPGDKTDYEISADGTVQLTARKRTFADSAGMLARKGQKRASLEDMDAAVTDAVVQRLRRSGS